MLRVDTANLFYTTANGTLFVTNYNTSSDFNLKDDIITITDGLSTVEKLRGVSFTWKNSKEKSYGVIAKSLKKYSRIWSVIQEVINLLTTMV
jgi:hypothetical protein